MTLMTTSNGHMDFETIQQVSKALVDSNYFNDTTQVAQAITKVLAGRELGLGPFASMTGIYIIKGKPALGANLLASLIKNDPRYNYRVKTLTDDVCELDFYENGELCGVSVFTAEDAKRAGTQNMNRFPKNMLFARALSNGAKWHCPGIFGGAPIYTPDELGAQVDEDGDVIEGTVVATAQPGPYASLDDMAKDARPDPRGETSPQAQAQRERPHWTLKDSPGRRKAFHALGTEVYGDEWDDKRKEWAGMWGVESSNDFTREQVDKLMDGMLKKQSEMAKEAE